MIGPLFEPLRIGTLEVAARVFKSATHETRCLPDGRTGEAMIEFYEPMARAGTPLIITGNMWTSRQGRSGDGMAGIDAKDKIPGLRALADTVHEHGSRMFVQLSHCGRQSAGRKDAVSASDVRDQFTGTKPRPLRRDELPGLAESFAAAAYRAAEAGMDGVQIHCAHGYLLSQFLTPHTNRRTDEYGGPVENRMRIVLEVLRAVRARVGDDFPVIAKLNGDDVLPLRAGAAIGDQIKVARAMQDEGLDAIEISRGHYESPGAAIMPGRFNGFLRTQITSGALRDSPRLRRLAMLAASPVLERAMNRAFPVSEGFNLPHAEKFTAELEIPVICVGGFHTRPAMEAAINQGRCDAVSVARAMTADPYLYRHLQTGERDVPVCEYYNGCIARAVGQPLTCYSKKVRPLRDRMLATELPAPKRDSARETS